MARIPIEVEEDVYRRRTGSLLKKLIPLGIVAVLALWFARMDESRKRFILHLLRQAPYLPGRYFA